MRAVLYHEIDPSSEKDVLNEGIKRGASGDKSDKQKKMVDTFLDTHLPDWAENIQLCRGMVNYGYLTYEGKVIDITDGEAVSIEEFMAKNDQILLRLTVDTDDCFVSDLDLYDTLVRAMELDEQDSTREHLADRYWERIIPLADYEPGTIKRPEVMINTDILPSDIEVVKGD